MRRHFAFAGSVGYALTLLPGSGCSRTEPCPLRDRAELIDRIDESKPARPRTIQIATAWAAAANVPAALAPKIAQAVEQQGESFAFSERLLAVGARYTDVAERLARLGIPEVFAAAPLALSAYGDTALGPDCGAGTWLLTPTNPRLRVAGCRLRTASELWSPPAPPPTPLTNEGRCEVAWCDIDERKDFSASTLASLDALSERWASEVDRPDRLEALVRETARVDPALPLAWHMLATCLYATAELEGAGRWGEPAPWCPELGGMTAEEVERCSNE